MGTNITKDEFEKFITDCKLNILSNNADGDCFFESMAQLLFERIEYSGVIRQRVCDFYEGFKHGAYPFTPFDDEFDVLTRRSNKAELINNLKYLLLQDSDGEHHSKNVCSSKIYARDSEMATICLLYEVNLMIFMVSNNSVDVFQLTYELNKPTLLLHFVPGRTSSNEGHYQAIKPGDVRKTQHAINLIYQKIHGNKDTQSISSTTHRLEPTLEAKDTDQKLLIESFIKSFYKPEISTSSTKKSKKVISTSSKKPKQHTKKKKDPANIVSKIIQTVQNKK